MSGFRVKIFDMRAPIGVFLWLSREVIVELGLSNGGRLTQDFHPEA